MEPGVGRHRPGDIVLGNVLGRGSFGRVLEGKCWGEEWAVKIMRVEKEKDVECSRKEALLMRRFENHNTIPRAVGFFLLPQEGEAWLLMELVDGEPLSRVSANQRVRKKTQLELSYQLWDGLSFIHAKFGAHRDLHSGNILVTRDLRRAVIIDYGRATVYSSEHEMGALHSNSDFSPPGSPYFAAPELIVQGKRHPQKSDVYALGISLGGFYARRFFWVSHNGKSILPYVLVVKRITDLCPLETAPVWKYIPHKFHDLVKSSVAFSIKERCLATEMKEKIKIKLDKMEEREKIRKEIKNRKLEKLKIVTNDKLSSQKYKKIIKMSHRKRERPTAPSEINSNVGDFSVHKNGLQHKEKKLGKKSSPCLVIKIALRIKSYISFWLYRIFI
jgi:serine/threonine protein kinase